MTHFEADLFIAYYLGTTIIGGFVCFLQCRKIGRHMRRLGGRK